VGRARDTDRDETAFVYLFTRMFDERLIDADDTFTIDIFGRKEKRKGGTEAILTVLDHADQPLRTPEVVGRVNDRLNDGKSLSRRRVLEKLNGLAEEDLVGKFPWTGRSKRWTLDAPPRHGTLKRTERAGQ
jgi:hypothetical protein